ncbi:MAG: hypothetical protein ACLTK0_11820 [Anaerovoracaceae bacterium]
MKKKVTILLLALCLVFLQPAERRHHQTHSRLILRTPSLPDEIIEGIGSDGLGRSYQALIDKVLEFDYELGEERSTVILLL